MEQQVRSAKAYSDSVTALAHAKAGKEVPETHRDPVPLVPIYIGVDREPQEPLREVMSVFNRLAVLLGCNGAAADHTIMLHTADVSLQTWR